MVAAFVSNQARSVMVNREKAVGAASAGVGVAAAASRPKPPVKCSVRLLVAGGRGRSVDDGASGSVAFGKHLDAHL